MGNLISAKSMINMQHQKCLNDELETACGEGYFDEVKSLIHQGAKVNECDAFSFACKHGRLDIVKYLHLEANADINIFNDWSLYLASTYGQLDTVKYLVENGADIQNRQGISIKVAIRYNHIGVVNYLKEQVRKQKLKVLLAK